MLRHEALTVYQAPRVELFNMDWAKKKKLNDMRTKFTHGYWVFIEQGSIKTTKFESLNWYKSIAGEEDLVKLHILGSDFGKPTFEVKLNKKKTLLDLKKKIGGIIDTPPEQFIIKRKHVVRELKENDLKLLELGLNNGSILEIKKGVAHIEGKYEL